MRTALFLAAMLLSAGSVSAQETGTPAAGSPQKLPSPATTARRAEANVSTFAGGCDLKDASAAKACNEALVENYLYLITAYRHRRDSFSWNLTASQIMFFMVVLMVISGLLFAAVQFWISMSLVRNARLASGKTGVETDLEISGTGVKVSSSVLGVIILVISMAFFYMYALYVYPIHEVHQGAEDVVQGTPK